MKLKRRVLFPTPESPISNSLNKYSNSASRDDVVADSINQIRKRKPYKSYNDWPDRSSLEKKVEEGGVVVAEKKKEKEGSEVFLEERKCNLLFGGLRLLYCYRHYQPLDHHVA